MGDKEIIDRSSGWKMMGKEYHLGDKVSIEIYDSNDIFEVVGIRNKELELKGDWSGGTAPEQTGWYPVEKCKLVLPGYDWKTIKQEDIRSQEDTLIIK
jgi:hypothetical protein